MKRAPITYRRPPWPEEKFARLREIERDFHVHEFGDELARVNLDLSMKERLEYLEWMQNLGQRYGLRFTRDLEAVERKLLEKAA